MNDQVTVGNTETQARLLTTVGLVLSRTNSTFAHTYCNGLCCPMTCIDSTLVLRNLHRANKFDDYHLLIHADHRQTYWHCVNPIYLLPSLSVTNVTSMLR